MAVLDSTAFALDATARNTLGIALACSFALSMLSVLAFIRGSKIDHGFLGLIFLLVLIFFLIGFSVLVAASVPGWDIKLAVVAVDACVVIGSKLLAPRFLQYLES